MPWPAAWSTPATTATINGVRSVRSRPPSLQKAEGMVVFAHWGCKGTIGASALFKRTFEAAGYPTLILDGDIGDPANCSDGQMATRFGAFIEMLEDKRK